MPISKATPQETREWLGGGLVMPGRRPPKPSEESLTQPQPQPQQENQQEPPAS